MKKRNKIVRISLSGGIIGLLFTNPRKALDDAIDKANQDDWNAIYFSPHKTSNLFVHVFQLTVLLLTLGFWTFGAGYMILFEKESAK